MVVVGQAGTRLALERHGWICPALISWRYGEGGGGLCAPLPGML
jgi:hypothetical protein